MLKQLLSQLLYVTLLLTSFIWLPIISILGIIYLIVFDLTAAPSEVEFNS